MSTNTPVKSKTNASITFLVEHLSPPENLLPEIPLSEILSNFSTEVKGHSTFSHPLVESGAHPFLYGMYQAYSEHRPYVISPDMIWLLICQGFSRFVRYNKSTKQDMFPHIKTMQTIEVKINDSSSVQWDIIPALFVQELEKNLKDGLVDLLRADFSTTSFKEKVASEITIMDTMRPYFKYLLIVTICGIPEITLEGTTEDWKKIKDKLHRLKPYGCESWLVQLEPIIDEFIAASKGEIDVHFWMNMFKVHTTEDYGSPSYIDGWIITFYPIDKNGHLIDDATRKKLTVGSISEKLPKELVSVDFKCKCIGVNGETLYEKDMIYWAGFLGLKQKQEDFSLRPEIGWFLCEKSANIPNQSRHPYETESRAYYHLTAFPKEVLAQKEWEILQLNFVDEIEIPMQLLSLSIKSELSLNGKLKPSDKWKIPLLEKRFRLRINDVAYY